MTTQTLNQINKTAADNWVHVSFVVNDGARFCAEHSFTIPVTGSQKLNEMIQDFILTEYKAELPYHIDNVREEMEAVYEDQF